MEVKQSFLIISVMKDLNLFLFYIDYFSNNTLSFVLGSFAYKPEISLYSSGFIDNDYLLFWS